MNNSSELITETEKWNLRSDEKLLESLKLFSDNLNKRASLLVQNLDNLNYETVDAECNLRNTFNEFLMLADTQFIENVSQ
jgi:WASH complex subunit FAM21